MRLRVHMASLAAVTVLSVASIVSAQDFNVDIGLGSTPSSAYAAAGQAGCWQTLPAPHGGGAVFLEDVDGQLTSVTMSQIGGTELATIFDPTITGDDEALLSDHRMTFSAVLETCIFLGNLEPGEYELLIYAVSPAQPGVPAYTSCDQEPGFPHLVVTGEWPGQHEEGVTYSRHVAEVGANGALWFHSGVVPGEDPTNGAAMNGFQVRRIVPIPGDFDESGTVDVTDLLQLLQAWGDCPGCVEDLTGDDQVNTGDLLELLANWG